LTVIQLLRLKFSNLRDRWLSSPQNKISPNSCNLFREVLPLTTVKAIGAINRMITNNWTRGNRARVLLHVLGGV
jgi:hypothetical protein